MLIVGENRKRVVGDGRGDVDVVTGLGSAGRFAEENSVVGGSAGQAGGIDQSSHFVLEVQARHVAGSRHHHVGAALLHLLIQPDQVVEAGIDRTAVIGVVTGVDFALHQTRGADHHSADGRRLQPVVPGHGPGREHRPLHIGATVVCQARNHEGRPKQVDG